MKSAKTSVIKLVIATAYFTATARAADIVVSTPISVTQDLAGNSLTVTNAGSITATPGANLQNATGTFVLNNGSIISNAANSGAINLNAGILTDSITNYGVISNIASGGVAILLTNSSTLAGSLINYGNISVSGSASATHAIALNGTPFANNNILGGIYNYGTIQNTASAETNAAIRINGSNVVSGGITNSGLISSWGRGISSGGTIDFISNTGTISAGVDAIHTGTGGSIGTISNNGSILGGSGYSINNINNRTITTLNNSQGLMGSGAATFTYQGKLPNNYNIIVSNARYGQLQAFSAVAPTATTMSFNIYNTSVLEALTYDSVLSGISSSLINPSSLSGNFGSYSWSLQQTATGSGIWNLFVFSYDMSTGGTFLASNIGNNFNPIFAGGTLQMNQANTIYSQNFTVSNAATNTIDQDGNTSTFSGVFSNATGQTGNLVITNTGVGGKVIFTGANTYTGSTTINSGATVAINGSMLSNMIVNAGAQLQGNGSFGGGTINGILAPGHQESQ